MPNTKVNETVQVAMLFHDQEIRPAAFVWNGRKYDVIKVLLAHKTRQGNVLHWHFAVETVGGGNAELLFNTLSLNWKLEGISQ